MAANASEDSVQLVLYKYLVYVFIHSFVHSSQRHCTMIMAKYLLFMCVLQPESQLYKLTLFIWC